MKKLSKDGSIHVTNEIINSITHLAGSIFSILGVAILIVKSSVINNPWYIVSFSIYGASLILLFLASTLHHAIDSTAKIMKLLKLADYLAIFPLIAGTFTPICLVLLRDPFGWTVLGVIWGIAIIGMVIKAIFKNIPKWVTNTFYICMGWIGGVLTVPFYQQTGLLGFGLLLSGAFFYTLGFIIYNIEKPNPLPGIFGFHEIWHILVMLGALSHYLMMYFCVLSK
jgi:hemolysin III